MRNHGEEGRAIAGPSMTVRRLVALGAGLAILFALSALFSACGDGEAGRMWGMGDMHREMHGGGSRAPQTPVLSSASEVTVEISNFDFFPRDLTVEGGSSVTWVNRDTVPHDATDAGRDWATGTLLPRESATVTFDSPGTYEYVCTIHPNMEATLTVA